MVAAKILGSTCLTPSYLTQFLPSYNSLQILSTTIIVSWCSGKIDLNSTKIYTNNLWMSLHIFMSSVFTIEDPNFMVTSILSIGSCHFLFANIPSYVQLHSFIQRGEYKYPICHLPRFQINIQISITMMCQCFTVTNDMCSLVTPYVRMP